MKKLFNPEDIAREISLILKFLNENSESLSARIIAKAKQTDLNEPEFHQTVNLDIIKFLGLEQIFKNALTNSAHGRRQRTSNAAAATNMLTNTKQSAMKGKTLGMSFRSRALKSISPSPARPRTQRFWRKTVVPA